MRIFSLDKDYQGSFVQSADKYTLKPFIWIVYKEIFVQNSKKVKLKSMVMQGVLSSAVMYI